MSQFGRYTRNARDKMRCDSRSRRLIGIGEPFSDVCSVGLILRLGQKVPSSQEIDRADAVGNVEVDNFPLWNMVPSEKASRQCF